MAGGRHAGAIRAVGGGWPPALAPGATRVGGRDGDRSRAAGGRGAIPSGSPRYRGEAGSGVGLGPSVEIDDDIRLNPVVGTCADLDRYAATVGAHVGDGPDEYAAGAVGEMDYEVFLDGAPLDEVLAAADPAVAPARYRTRVVVEDGFEYLEAHDFDVEFTVETEIAVLDWRPTHPISAACREAWCEQLRTTVEHERQHARDAVEAAAVATARWRDGEGWDSGPRQRLLAGESPDDELVVDLLEREIHAELEREAGRIDDYFAARSDELHERDPGAGSLCDHCPSCEDGDAPTYGTVETWELRVYERLEAWGSWTDESGSPVEGWTNRAASTRVVLEPVGMPDLPEGEDGVLGVLIAIVRMILAFLTPFLRADERGRPRSSQLVWQGSTASGHATESSGYVAGENGEFSHTRHGTGVLGGRIEPDEVELVIDVDEDQYTLTFPTVPVEGRSRTVHTESGLVGSSEYESVVGVSDLIELRAQGRANPGLDPADYEEARWPTECGVVLANDLTVKLDGEGIDPLTLLFYRGPEGMARTAWILAPRTLVADREPASIRCD